MTLAVVLGASAGGGGCAGPPPPDNVVVLLVDTLRADHLGCYGYERDTSPNLDRLASEGVLFENAIAQSSWTSPSVASLFTSLYPSAHGVVRFSSKLGTNAPTLAQEMTARGRTTGGVSANIAFIRADRGFALGFSHFELAERRAGPGDELEKILRRAPEEAAAVTDRGLAFIDQATARPFFLYLHYLDPHSPYDAPPPHRDRFLDDAQKSARPRFFGEAGMVSASAADLPTLTALYDGEISYTDAEIGRFLDGLRERGLLERTVVVVTSDHGEELLDHGGFTHGSTLYREVVRVPLLVRMPEMAAAGRRVADVVELVDVGPTLLELVGPPDARKTEGQSLAAMLRPTALLERIGLGSPSGTVGATGYSELSSRMKKEAKPSRHERALRRAGRSYLVSASGERELYDDVADPREQHDLAAAEPDTARDLARRIEALAASSAGSAAQSGSGSEDESMSEADRERLKALGYLQ